MMHMTIEEERLEKLKQGFNILKEKAMADGIITEDEAAILKVIEEHIGNYEKLVHKALEDGVITQDEKNELIDLEEKMMSEAYFVAEKDKIITKDEAELVKLFIKILDEKAYTEWLDELTQE